MIWRQGKKGARLRKLRYMFSIGKKELAFILAARMTSKIKRNYRAHVWNQVRCDGFSRYLMLSEKMQ